MPGKVLRHLLTATFALPTTVQYDQPIFLLGSRHIYMNVFENLERAMMITMFRVCSLQDLLEILLQQAMITTCELS